MLSTLRRGSASVARQFRPLCTATRGNGIHCSQVPIKSRTYSLLLQRRAFASKSYLRQSIASASQPAVDPPGEEHENGSTSPSTPNPRRDANHGPITMFHELADRGMVSSVVVNTMTEKMKLETMTEVQSQTINESLKGVDM